MVLRPSAGVLVWCAVQCVVLCHQKVSPTRWHNTALNVAHSMPTCAHVRHSIKARAERIVADEPPSLKGQWTSTRCEIGPGPSYTLRHYTFSPTESTSHMEGAAYEFRTIQYHYKDIECTIPTYTVDAVGKLRLTHQAWLTPGGTNAEYRPVRITVTAAGDKTRWALAKLLNQTDCLRQANTWLVLYDPTEENEEVQNTIGEWKSRGEERPFYLDCTSSIHFALHELQLVRVERDTGTGQTALFLGDIHPDPRQRMFHRPSSYQHPLSSTHQCGEVCRAVLAHNATSPASLDVETSHGYLVGRQAISGHWISSRCEAHSSGNFLLRKMHFYGRHQRWSGHYHYYSDPLCLQPSMTVVAVGKYSLVTKDRKNPTLRTSSIFDLKVTALTLKPLDKNTVSYLNQGKRGKCGLSRWKDGVSQDLVPTNGCVQYGLVVPSVHREAISVVTDGSGHSELTFASEAGHGWRLAQCHHVVTHHSLASRRESHRDTSQLPVASKLVLSSAATHTNPRDNITLLIIIYITAIFIIS